MANMTLAIPEDLHKKIRAHSEVKWSEVARQAIQNYVAKLELVDRLAGKSRLSEKEAEEISLQIKKAVAAKHRSLKG
ncbi:MAG: hypothetical protein ABH950_09240 [Candidatus Altiarchaeota archaeon]